ncbi:MAG: hypothetical protein K0S25_52 [Bacillus sp. (in: firmicutes)]|jgi:hypothetical protein|nr:hypothetical protein [Bacillus sp. (in: firmicutes)]
MTTIQVYLQDGNTITVQLEGYNAEELAVKMNDQKTFMISLGDLIVNKTIVKYIAPVQ